MINTEIRPLCLSFWTPPIVRPQSILIGKMIPEWERQGVRPVIMTYDICGDWQIGLPIYKIPQFSIGKRLAKIPGLVTIFEIFYYRKLFRAAKKIIKKHQINLVFSFANPQASNILGAMIAKKMKIKFVAHFSDPWFDNPYKKFSFWGTKKVRFLERFIMENSNRVIFVSEQTKRLVMKKYRQELQERALVIPHCFDLQDYPPVQKPSGEKFIFSYIGAFYSKRNPEMLFRIFGALQNDSEVSGKFKFRLVGGSMNYATYKQDLQKMANENGLENIVEIIPPVDYKKSLELMKLSDCLIVIDADFPNSPFLPSKAVDYAAAGRTVVGITPENSPTAEFLRKLGYRAFSHDQINELVDHLKKLILGEINPQINKDFLDQFDVSITTAKLINQFKQVLEE